jgi:putative oxidoreductase
MKDAGLLIIRISLGACMLPHGISKLNRVIAGKFDFADPIGIGEAPSLILATFAEFVCAILVILGVKTRLASIPLAITMAVAAFITHFDDPWSKKELPVLYLAGFIALALIGSGKYALKKD